MCNTFDVSLMVSLPSVSMATPAATTSLQIPVVPVAGINLQGMNIEALIGRDILCRCLFVYDGRARQWMIAF
jgi:hypothetical protein